MNRKIKILMLVILTLGLGVLGGYWVGRMSPPSHEGHVHETVQTDAQEEALYTCPMHPQYITEQPGDCPICGMSLVPVSAAEDRAASAEKKEKKILYWQAPMDPSYIRNAPGKSPMGMDLIPVYAEEEPESEAGAIRIDPVTVQNMGVRTAPVERRSLSREIRTVGRIDYDETRVHHVQTKMKGWVERLHVDFTGEDVTKGAPLLEIYSPELVSTQEEYLLALRYRKSLGKSPSPSIAEGADALLAATRKRLRLWDIAPAQISALERRGTASKSLTLHSPAGGVVVDKTVQQGMYVQPGMNLYTIADISRLWVLADIYEYELPWLRVGQEAEMTLSYLKGKTFPGRITYIYPFLDKKTRTVKVRMEFDNPDGALKPEMYANVKIQSPVSDATLVVPTEAVLRSGERDLVVVMRESGKFLPRNVQLGAEGEGYYQILAGLDEGERVVTSAQFLIDSESKLKEAINKMLAARQAKMEREKHPAPEKTDAAEHADHEYPSATPVAPLSEEIRTTMGRILDGYLKIQQLLKEDSIEGVQPVVVEIATLTEQVQRLDKEHALHEIIAGITASAPEMLSGDMQTVREGFKKLSHTLTGYVKGADPEGARNRGLRIFYCPMVQEAWIQRGESVENPYYGASMLKCGTEVTY